MNSNYTEIDEVIAFIHRNLDESLSLTRLAKHVSYSPFHFTRIFKERIGLTPHYYISSLRLQRAKDLLLKTDLSIRDIGLEIGQQSLGTFTTRFTERVGVTPSAFRNSLLQVPNHLSSLKKLNDWEGMNLSKQFPSMVTGTIETPRVFKGIILIGLFEKPIPEGLPLYGTLLSSAGDFYFSDVRPGTYYLLATAVSFEMHATDILLPHRTLRAKSNTPITVAPYEDIPHQKIKLREPRLDDPPILISLPLLMRNFLNRTKT
ncbi:helix-turn-helix domain-containing protein [Ornithinibacillus sp. L9]|uniref:Helix-turn-helix domain-containing protein n=1 Tax=Ornithinibacillus caprae TaxID=2678566 RepID=A0A6N8FGM2_9BACI|nr:helix-turn-helix domain-containing protein [Ornithinibacillus caprae]MUK88605.1 helix-turn-helix domain-containing protein [Ornithinibacillus caprae]